ncbi:hypothetical protein DFH07DRAFT_323866 [Mycena maculata]|uniref:Uncharacterized protein n=1 Tax=Mycena maculata TaxID=230809 RepID=A0AAD7KBQ8_9AGAR|nr:hypothetical protein DFH07DRAFT_323866 [Mycena maculata]
MRFRLNITLPSRPCILACYILVLSFPSLAQKAPPLSMLNCIKLIQSRGRRFLAKCCISKDTCKTSYIEVINLVD